MQHGPYIADRLMPKAIRAICKTDGIQCQMYSDEWVIRLQKDSKIRWIVGYKFDANQSAAGELAQDKVAMYTALAASNVPAVEHYLVRSLPHELIHVDDLHQKLGGKRIVAKPLEGTGGRDVVLFDSIDDALNMIKQSGEPAWAVSPHNDFSAEYRLIMLNGALLLAYDKTEPMYRGELKMFNLSYGAIAAEIHDKALLSRLETIAKVVIQVTTLNLAAVDIVMLIDGSLRVLEVNDGISMEHYARQSAENKNLQKLFMA